MKKYIKLFEDFSTSLDNEREAESIYEKWRADLESSFFESLDLLKNDDLSFDINENEDFWEDETERELSAGELRAMARDFQIMTKEQLGALYLRALGDVEDDPGKYLVMIPNIVGFGRILDNGDFKITAPGLADALGLESFATISRTSKKFKNLITGVGETSSEAIYPKILSAYEYFKTQKPGSIANMIKVNNPEEYTLNRDKAAELASKAGELAKERKKMMDQIGQNVLSLFNSLKDSGLSQFKSTANALNFALNKIAQEKNIEIEKLRQIYKKYLVSRGMNMSLYYAE